MRIIRSLMSDQTLWLFAGAAVFLQTLDTLRRYFTAKKRWSLSTLALQLLLLPTITIAGFVFFLEVVLPMMIPSAAG